MNSHQPRRVVVALPGTLPGALAAIGRALDFPDYYGHNLDALLDCLRDLEEPTEVRLAGWQQLAWHDPEGWARLRQVLTDREQESDPSLWQGSGSLPVFRVMAD